MINANDPSQSTPNGSAHGAIVARGSSEMVPSRILGDGGSLAPAVGTGPVHSAPISLSILLEFKWSILVVSLLISAITVPLVWAFVVPVYRASAVIRVSPVIARLLYKYEDNGIVPLYQSYLNTQVSIIRSPKILQRVLDDPAVQATAWYKEDSGTWLRTQLPPLQRLKRGLAVGPRRGTELIDVSMESRDPKEATVIVSAVVREYLDSVRTSERSDYAFKLKTLDEEEKANRTEIEGKRRTKEALARRLGTDSPEQLRSQMATTLTQMRGELRELRDERRLNTWRIAQLDPKPDATVTADGASGSDASAPVEADRSPVRYASDVEWRQLNRALSETAQELEVARDLYGEQHPTLKRQLTVHKNAKSRLRIRESELDAGLAPSFLAVAPPTVGTVSRFNRDALEYANAELAERQSLLIQAIDTQRQDIEDVSSTAEQLAFLDEEIKRKRDVADLAHERLNVLRIEGKASKALARVSVTARAIPPVEPFRDRRIMLTMMSLAGAMMAGVALAILRSAMDTSVRRVEDVLSAVQVPFLGHLPKVRFESELLDETSDLLKENIRMIRTALLDRLSNVSGNAVLITSAGAKAGKTSVSIMLAKSLAGVGKSVLLVDADVRRSQLSKRLEIEQGPGLTDMLNNGLATKDAVWRGHLGGVDLLSVGTCPSERDPELMANGVFSQCLQDWKKSYDFVILDSPPVLPVADARILASQVDGTILALRASHCRRKEVMEAATMLETVGGKLLGTILVGTDRPLRYEEQYSAHYNG